MALNILIILIFSFPLFNSSWSFKNSEVIVEILFSNFFDILFNHDHELQEYIFSLMNLSFNIDSITFKLSEKIPTILSADKKTINPEKIIIIKP